MEQTDGEESPGQTASQLMKQVLCACTCMRAGACVCLTSLSPALTSGTLLHDGLGEVQASSKGSKVVT